MSTADHRSAIPCCIMGNTPHLFPLNNIVPHYLSLNINKTGVHSACREENGYKVDICVHATAQAGVNMKWPTIIFEYLMLPGP